MVKLIGQKLRSTCEALKAREPMLAEAGDDEARESEVHHAHDDAQCTSLCCARSGQKARVTGFRGGAHEASRLRDLGMREGAVVTVLGDGNPLMIRIDDTRVGIGRSAATNILCDLY